MELSGWRRMTRTRCLLAPLAMGVLAVLLVLPTAEAARTGNGHPSTLTLEPTSGLPDSRVIAVARGFERCLPVRPSPKPSPVPSESSSPSDEPVAKPAVLSVTGGTIEFLWDGSEVVATAEDSGSGVARAIFSVPKSATIGMHQIVARCPGTEGLSASAQFEVIRSGELVPVPRVIGMKRPQAELTLIAAELSVGQVSGDGKTVKTQNPPPGDEVERGRPVDLDFGTVGTPPTVTPQPPTMVVVPKLIGRSINRVPALLAVRELVLGPVTGKGRIVRDQSPAPGSRVPARSAVSVSTRADVDASVMIRVPALEGSKVSDARSTLAAVKLKLGGTPDDNRDVATQQPPAGTFVKAGTVVTVTLASIRLVRVPNLVGGAVADARTALSAVDLVLGDTDTPDRAIVGQEPAAGTLVAAGTTVTVTYEQSFSWAAAAGLLAALSGAAAVATRMVRQRLDHRWIRRMVSVVAIPAPDVMPAITEARANSRMPIVRIEPHRDGGTHVLEEV